jgi:8-oxo-dGTP pyrophosphatase MutT (NUDIX family)
MTHLDLLDGKIKNARAIIWRDEEGKRLFLITQELSGDVFTLSGGCKDLEDKDFDSTLERELREELGLYPKDYVARRVDWEKEYENLYGDPSSERYRKNTIIYPFLVFVTSSVPLIVQTGEIKDAVWLDEAAARRALDHSPHMKEIFEIGLKEFGKMN